MRQTKTLTQVSTATTVSAAAMVAVSAVALSVAGGMMVVAGFPLVKQNVVRIAIAEGDTFGQPVWEWYRESYAGSDVNLTLADTYMTEGMEVVGHEDLVAVGQSPLLFYTHDGRRVNLEFSYNALNARAPTVFDREDDGMNEIAFVEYRQSRGMVQLVVTNQGGTVLGRWNFPPIGNAIHTGISPPAVVDLNADGIKDFVVTANFLSDEEEPEENDIVYALNGTGGILWQYVLRDRHGRRISDCTSPPMTPDVDHDGKYDVFFVSCDCLAEGDLAVPNNPDIIEFPFSQPHNLGVIEVGEDRVLRVGGGGDFCGTAVYRLNHQGALVWRKFVNDKQNFNEGYRAQLAAADLEYDETLDIVATPWLRFTEGLGDQLVALRSNGSILWDYHGKDRRQGLFVIGAIGDVVGDKFPEIVTTFATQGRGHMLGVFSSRGSLLRDWDIPSPVFGDNVISVADLNAGGKQEIIVTAAGYRTGETRSKIAAYGGDGSFLWSYPAPNGERFHLGGSVADLDGDGILEGIFEGYNALVSPPLTKHLMIRFPQSRVVPFASPWAMSRHDTHRTAWYDYADPDAFPASASVRPPLFRRGDADGNGQVNLTDAIFTLNALFKAGPQPQCQDASDADDSGQINLTDAVFTLKYLFSGSGRQPPLPGPEIPGQDPTADGLGCVKYLAP